MRYGMRWTPERLAEFQKKSAAAVPAPSRPKFGNVATESDGDKFDSKKEAKNHANLRMRMRAGEFVMLGRQVEFALPGNTVYRADHVHGVKVGDLWRLVVLDTKSEPTRKREAYRIKVRQLKQLHGIDVVEI